MKNSIYDATLLYELSATLSRILTDAWVEDASEDEEAAYDRMWATRLHRSILGDLLPTPRERIMNQNLPVRALTCGNLPPVGAPARGEDEAMGSAVITQMRVEAEDEAMEAELLERYLQGEFNEAGQVQPSVPSADLPDIGDDWLDD